MVFWTPWDQIGTKWEEEEVVWLLAGCVSGLAGRPGCQFVLSGLVVCLLAGYVPGRLGRLASRPRRAGSLAGCPHKPAAWLPAEGIINFISIHEHVKKS